MANSVKIVGFFRRGALVALLGCLPSFGGVKAEGNGDGVSKDAAQDSGRRVAHPAMPNMSHLLRRTSRSIKNTGRLIKGIYYVDDPGGPNVFLSFHNACYQSVEDNPFLVVDFEKGTYFFDADRNGFVDEVGVLRHSEIDPVDFYMRLPDATTYCYDDGHPT